MERKLEWLVTRALDVLPFVVGLIGLLVLLQGCSAAVSSRDGEIIRLDVERKPFDLRSSTGQTSALVQQSASAR